MSKKLLSRDLANSMLIDAQKENSVLACALADLLNLGAAWFGDSHAFSLGITRPQSACGGIAIVRQCGTVSAHYFEEYAQRELNHISAVITGENTERNRELLCRRSAIESAQAYISEQQEVA